MADPDPTIEKRVSSLEIGLTTLTANLNNFVTAQREDNQAQREEINKLYLAIKELGTGFSHSVEGVKSVLGEKGKITGNFILALITTGVSVTAIISALVQSYVTTRVEAVRGVGEQTRLEMQHISTDMKNAKEVLTAKIGGLDTRLDAEVARSLANDVKSEAERKSTSERMALIDQRRYDELWEEARWFREKVRNSFDLRITPPEPIKQP